MQDGSILAFDYGDKRVGVARAGEIARIAEPLVTLDNNDELLNAIGDLIEEHKANLLIVGLPQNVHQKDTEQTTKVRQFAEKLHQFGISQKFQDEALSTRQADELQKTDKNAAKHTVDSIAASIILDSWLQENS